MAARSESEARGIVLWLRRYQKALADERWLRERIADIRARAEATTRALRPDPVDGGVRENRLLACVELLDERRRELAGQVAASERLRAEIERAIGGVPDEMQRHVLTARYIDGAPWWKIANQLYISERWAKALHRRAVEQMEEKEGENESQNCISGGRDGRSGGRSS